jgi:hypothetical protein
MPKQKTLLRIQEMTKTRCTFRQAQNTTERKDKPPQMTLAMDDGRGMSGKIRRNPHDALSSRDSSTDVLSSRNSIPAGNNVRGWSHNAVTLCCKTISYIHSECAVW